MEVIVDIPWPRPGYRCTVRSSCPSLPVCCLTEADEYIPDPGGEKAKEPAPRDYGQQPHLPVTVLRPPPWKGGGRKGAADNSPPFRVVSRQGNPDQGYSNELPPCFSSAGLKNISGVFGSSQARVSKVQCPCALAALGEQRAPGDHPRSPLTPTHSGFEHTLPAAGVLLLVQQ